MFVTTNDPLYKLQRAISIYHEMWPVPEKEIVKEYIDYLCLKYPWLWPKRRMYELTAQELNYLHTGVEGASCKRERAKSLLYHGKEDNSLGSNPRKLTSTNMTKTKAQKEKKKAARAAGFKELAKLSPAASAAAQSALVVSKAAKKTTKKKKTGFWDLVSGAAKTAAELAPLVAPLILAKHGPTAMNAAALGSGATAGVPLAQSASCATCTGCYSMKPKTGSDGRVTGVTLRGMDFLGDVSVNGPALAAGAVLEEVNLNPYSQVWDGTQLQRFATLYERYRPRRIAFMVEPSCPATTAGQILGFVDPDPDDEFAYTGNTAVQVASSHQGADISQVWQMNCAAFVFDSDTQDYFADADGSDERLVSPGIYRVIAGTTLAENLGTIGSIYCAWEYEFKLTQLGEAALGGAYAILEAGDPTSTSPMGTQDWNSVKVEGDMEAILGQIPDEGGNYFTGLKPGFYEVFFGTAGSSTPQLTISCDGENYYQTAGSGTISFDSRFSASTTAKVTYKFSFTVQEYTSDWETGYIGVTGGAGTLTGCNLFIVRCTNDLTKRRRKTLQKYEDDVETLKVQVAQMRELLSSLPRDAFMPQTTTSGSNLLSAALSAARR
jgi:hypothetical protein